MHGNRIASLRTFKVPRIGGWGSSWDVAFVMNALSASPSEKYKISVSEVKGTGSSNIPSKTKVRESSSRTRSWKSWEAAVVRGLSSLLPMRGVWECWNGRNGPCWIWISTMRGSVRLNMFCRISVGRDENVVRVWGSGVLLVASILVPPLVSAGSALVEGSDLLRFEIKEFVLSWDEGQQRLFTIYVYLNNQVTSEWQGNTMNVSDPGSVGFHLTSNNTLVASWWPWAC